MTTKELTNRVQDWQRRARQKASKVGEATDTYVRKNTWTTLAIAALVGCVVGYVLSGDRD